MARISSILLLLLEMLLLLSLLALVIAQVDECPRPI